MVATPIALICLASGPAENRPRHPRRSCRHPRRRMDRTPCRPCPRRPAARLRRGLRTGPRPRGRVPHRHRTAHPNPRPCEDEARSRRIAAVRRQHPVHGKPTAPSRAERRRHPRRAYGRHGPRSLPARPRPPRPRQAPPTHPNRGRRRTRQDLGGRHPRQRADRPRPGPAHPRAGSQEHAHAVPEGVLEPLHDPADAPRLARHPARAQPHSHQSQPVLLLRQIDHLHRHAEAGHRVPHLSGRRVLGHHRDRRGAQRRGPGIGLAAQPPGRTARTPVRHAHHALRDAARRQGEEFREPGQHARPDGHRRPGRLLQGTVPARLGDPPIQEGHPGAGAAGVPRPRGEYATLPGVRSRGGGVRGPAGHPRSLPLPSRPPSAISTS